MNILFLTDNFPPEFNAPATRTHEHCKEWVRLGATVTVVTCFPNFPQGQVFEGYRNKWKQTEFIDGIKVIRVWSFISQNSGVFKRTLDFVSFAITSFICGISIRSDIIVATSPQFFTAMAGCALGIVKRKKWIMEVRDIWPESIKAVEAVSTKWVISLLEKVELFLYKHAHKVIVVTDSFKKNLVSRGVSHDKVYVVKNGVDISIYKPQPKKQSLIQKHKLDDKFIIGYLGTHGLAHGLDFIVRSIKKLNDDSFHFLFIGDGAEKKNIVELSMKLELRNISFIDPVKKSDIPNYLSIFDAALVPLKKSPTFESVIPSKIFESAALNVPILLGVNGETRSIIEFYNAGLYFEPENESEFIETLISIRQKIKPVNIFVDGCQKMAYDFNRSVLAKKMLDILSQ